MKMWDVALDSGSININCNGGCIFIHKVVKSESKKCFLAGHGRLFVSCCSPPPSDHCEGDLPGQRELQDSSHISSVWGEN